MFYSYCWAFFRIEKGSAIPRGVLLSDSWWGCAARFSNPDTIHTKICYFSHPFSDLASKKLCHRCLDWNTNKHDFFIRTFFFFSYPFGIKRINTFIHSRSSLENHIRFQTKMGKVYTHFQTKTVQKPYPLGRDIPYMAYTREYTSSAPRSRVLARLASPAQIGGLARRL